MLIALIGILTLQKYASASKTRNHA